MTSPIRLIVTGRQSRLQFGPAYGPGRAVLRGAAAAARPTASLSDKIAGLIRIAAPRYGVGGNTGSVGVTPPRAPLPVIIRGNQPQSRLAAAPRHLREKPGSGLTEGKHRPVATYPVHIRSLAKGTEHGRTETVRDCTKTGREREHE